MCSWRSSGYGDISNVKENHDIIRIFDPAKDPAIRLTGWAKRQTRSISVPCCASRFRSC
jgi:hypothetical protein